MSILDPGETASESEFKQFLRERLPEINTAVSSYNYQFTADDTQDAPELSTYYNKVIGEGGVGAGPYAGYHSFYGNNSAGTRKAMLYFAPGWFSDNAGAEYSAFDIFVCTNGDENYNIISSGWFASWDVASEDDTTFPDGWSNNMRLYSETYPCVLWGIGGTDGHGGLGYDVDLGNFQMFFVSSGNTVDHTKDILINPFYGSIAVGSPTGGVGTTRGVVNVQGDVKKNNTSYTNPDYALENYFEGQITQYAKNEGAAEYNGLVPLDSLESYLRRYLRLPGITSHGEGVGIFKRADLALEKIEEAWLYIVQLHNRLRELEDK